MYTIMKGENDMMELEISFCHMTLFINNNISRAVPICEVWIRRCILITWYCGMQFLWD